MNSNRIKGTAAAAAVILTLVVAGCASKPTTTPLPPVASTGTTTQASGAIPPPSNGHVLPVPSNPIVNTSTTPGLEITAAKAENNVDPVTKKDLSDRLMVTLKNTSSKTMSNLEAFYEMTDTKTKQTEGYYQALTGFTLAPGATGTISFDGEAGVGHYPEDAYSLYRTSTNEVVIAIEVSAPGFAPANSQAVKAVGTGEVAGE